MMADVDKIPVATIEHMPRVDGATALVPAAFQPIIDAAAKFHLIPHGFSGARDAAERARDQVAALVS